MSEQEDALGDLDALGVLAALRWARESAYRRALDDHDEDTGYDQANLGLNAHKLLRDRLDRVFSCGKYGAPDGSSPSVGAAAIGAGLYPNELASMPLIPAGTVRSANMNGSPGWRAGDWSWLLSSFVAGRGDRIPWGRKSFTKQRVASMPSPDHPMLFGASQSVLDEDDILPADLSEKILATVLMLAHSVEPATGHGQLLLGRARMNRDGGEAWWWRQDLLLEAPGSSGRGRLPVGPVAPTSSPASDVPDAVVRLRRELARGEDAQGDAR